METELDLNVTSSTNLLLADDSLEEIYQVYNRKVYGYFRRNGFDHEAAEDLTQEVFCRLLRFKDTFESDDQIRNWIFKVARNLLIDVLRKKENGSAKPILMEDLPSFDTLIMDHIHVEGPEQTFVTEESNGEVMSLIEELSPRYADVIRLRELEGLKYQEIAKELGMTAKAVEGLLHRARAKLRSNYTAFQRNYHGLLIGLGFIPRLLKRGTTATARTAWNEIKIATSKMAALSKSLGASSFISGTGLMSTVLAVLVAGGITVGSVALVQSNPTAAENGQVVGMTETPVALGENLAKPLTTLGTSPLREVATTDGLSIPLLGGILQVLDGKAPVLDLQGAVNSITSQVNNGLDQVLGAVDGLLDGTTALLGNVLSLVGTLPGLSGLTAVLVSGLSGVSIEPVQDLVDSAIGGVTVIADPVLGTVQNILNPLLAPVTNGIAPVGGTAGGLLGGVTGGTVTTNPLPATTTPQAPTGATPTVTDTTPPPPVTEPSPEPPVEPNPGLLPGVHIPIVSDLLPL